MTAGGIPVPRDGTTGGTDGEMLQYVAGTVGRLEESVERGFREQREAMATLAAATVTRREFDDKHGELRERVAKIETDREAERKARADAEEAARRRRSARRWQRIALATSSTLALAGTASGIVLHFT